MRLTKTDINPLKRMGLSPWCYEYLISLESELSDKIMHSYHHPPMEGIILFKAINRK